MKPALSAFALVPFLAALWGCLFDSRSAGTPVPEGPVYFPRDTADLSEAAPPAETDLLNGDTLRLTAAPVWKSINGRVSRMAAFNGSVPGPVLRVRQGDTVTVVLRNRVGYPLTLHPHGLRLDPHYDGAAGFSQAAVPDGEDFVYRLAFPDAGAFWYHSHVREDAFQILGLYGAILVAPRDPAYWNPVDLEVPLVIGEVPLDSSGSIAPIRMDKPDHVLMGRFGNAFLANGDTDLVIKVKKNAYVRFCLTNACNTRVLNVGVDMTWLKVIGSDNGRYPTSFTAATEYFGPGERVIFEAAFRDTGTFKLYHSTPSRFFRLARIHVEGDSAASGFADAYADRVDSVPSVIADIDSFSAAFGKEPDKRLLFTGTMDGMHMAMKRAADGYSARVAHGPDGSTGVEWSDTMATMNAMSTPENTAWIIRDEETGLENHDIFWHFKKGQKVLIRIRNDSNAVHSMPHPIHFHGQRFLVATVNGKKNTQLAWKDTYLVPAGATADLLLDASNPGGWMAHCHIAEHAEDGMMFHFRVD